MRLSRQELQPGRNVFGLLKFLQLILIAGILFSRTPTSVEAHARLTTSTPESGIALASMPAEFVLTFSEEIDISFSAATLLSVLDEPVALGTLTSSDQDFVLHIPVADPAAVAPGTYTLVWRVLSARDGHVTTGTVAVSAGTGVAPAITSDGTGRPPWWRVAIKSSELAGLVLTAGGFAFALLIARNSFTAFGRTAIRLRARSAAMLVTVLLFAGYDLGITASGRQFLDPPGFAVFRGVIFHSSVGRSCLVVTLCAAIMAILAFGVARDRRSNRWFTAAGFAAGLVAIFALSAGGHAFATSTPWRSTIIDWVHLTAVTFWLGSLPYLWIVIAKGDSTEPGTSATEAAKIVSRFSKAGLLMMAAVVATGFLRAADQVDGTRSLIQSDYGRTLIAKHLILIPILIAAGANILVVVPRLKRAVAIGVPATISSSLRSTQHFVSAEIVSAMLLLVAAGALTELTPAQGPLPVDVATRPSTIDQTAAAGDIDIWMLARLTGASNDRFTITLTGANGQVPDNLQKVIITTSIDVAGETIGDRFDAQQLTGSPGIYVFPALRLGLRGDWQVEVIARRAGVEDVSTLFRVDTTNTGAQPPRLVDDAWRMPRIPYLAWFFVACSLVVLGGGIVAIRRLPGIEPFAVAIMLTMIALITTGFAVQGYRQTIPVTAGTTLVNPVNADAGSIQRGADTYAMVCLECHGPGGGGIDDNDPDHLHPGGTNLTDARTKGQRDGDLFWSISTGIGGTDMPAFDPALSEQERWDLVNYLQTLRAADAERQLDTND